MEMKQGIFSVEITAAKRHGFVDVTDDLVKAVKDSGVTDGLAVAYCQHTTCALLLNEWEDGVLEDLTKRLETLVPGTIYYAHDDMERRVQNIQPDIDEPKNGQAHVIGMIIGGSSHAIPVEAGEPVLGRWQRLFLLELDHPKPRRLVFQVLGS